MKKFLFKVFLFVAALFMLDAMFFALLSQNRPFDYELFLQSKRDFFKDKNRKTDILIIGDSHIADALDTRTLENRLNLSAYNLGIYHTAPYENYYLTKSAFNHLENNPKYLILGTNPLMFTKPISKGKYVPLILPFSINKYEFIKFSNQGFTIEDFFPSLKESYLFKSILNKIKGKPYKPTREIEGIYKGHLKFFNQIDNASWDGSVKQGKYKLNQNQVYYFEETIKYAIEKGVKVIIVHPPIWKIEYEVIIKKSYYKTFENEINKVLNKYKIFQFPEESYYDSLTLNYSKNDYLNSQHLNYNGSTKFTNSFSNSFNDAMVLIKKRESKQHKKSM